MSPKTKEIVNLLMNIEDFVYEEFKVTYKQYGDTYIKMVLSMATKIINTIPIEQLTAEVKEQLTDSNYHTVNHAIDIVLEADKRSLREYCN